MSDKILDFYKGYEGENEIQFIKISPDGSKEMIKIWDGFFDDFMTKIKPEKEGWTSLAYYYHLVEGWNDESPWEIQDVLGAFEQLKQLNDIDFRFVKSKVVHHEVCKLLESALKSNSRVYIALE